MGKYKDFVDSLGENVDQSVLDFSDDILLRLGMQRITSASLHTQPNTLYQAAVCLYLLLENNDGVDNSMFIDPEEVGWLYMIGMMGDVIMSYIDRKVDAHGFPYWIDHATNLLSIILGHKNFKIGEFRYSPVQARSITTP